MVVEENVFDKEIETVIKKPKRKLTEKQLANLALGREKMKIKRELAKKNKEMKQNVKEDKIGAVEHQKETKKNHKQKRKSLKEINADKERQILARLEKEQTDKESKLSVRNDLFTTLKVKCLEKASSVSEYKQIKQALDGIDEDTLHDDIKLKDYAKNVMKPFMVQMDEGDDIKDIEISN